jgi:hypothetical protein
VCLLIAGWRDDVTAGQPAAVNLKRDWRKTATR